MNENPAASKSPSALPARRSIPQPTSAPNAPLKPLDEMTDTEERAFWRRRLRWREVAAELASGKGINEIARELQIEPYRIRRNLVRSARFRRWIYEEQSALMEMARRRMAALQTGLPEALARALAEGNPRLLAWFAEQLARGSLGLDTARWSTAPGWGPDCRPNAPSNFDTALTHLGSGVAHGRRRWSRLEALLASAAPAEAGTREPGSEGR